MIPPAAIVAALRVSAPFPGGMTLDILCQAVANALVAWLPTVVVTGVTAGVVGAGTVTGTFTGIYGGIHQAVITRYVNNVVMEHHDIDVIVPRNTCEII